MKLTIKNKEWASHEQEKQRFTGYSNHCRRLDSGGFWSLNRMFKAEYLYALYLGGNVSPGNS